MAGGAAAEAGILAAGSYRKAHYEEASVGRSVSDNQLGQF